MQCAQELTSVGVMSVSRTKERWLQNLKAWALERFEISETPRDMAGVMLERQDLLHRSSYHRKYR